MSVVQFLVLEEVMTDPWGNDTHVRLPEVELLHSLSKLVFCRLNDTITLTVAFLHLMRASSVKICKDYPKWREGGNRPAEKNFVSNYGNFLSSLGCYSRIKKKTNIEEENFNRCTLGIQVPVLMSNILLSGQRKIIVVSALHNTNTSEQPFV